MRKTHAALLQTLQALLSPPSSRLSSSSSSGQEEVIQNRKMQVAFLTIDVCRGCSSISSSNGIGSSRRERQPNEHHREHDRYPRRCPQREIRKEQGQEEGRPCTGHAFLESVEALGFSWNVEAIWSSKELEAVVRRVRQAPACVNGIGPSSSSTSSTEQSKREFSVIAPDDGLVLVSVST